MLLKDGTIYPIVEINARKSMTFLKHCLDRKIHQYNCKAILTYETLNLTDITMGDFISTLRKNELLFSPDTKSGILPLNANFLKVKNSKFYYGIIAHSEHLDETFTTVKNMFKKIKDI